MYNYIHIRIMYTYYVSDVPIHFEYVGQDNTPHICRNPEEQMAVDYEMISQKCLQIRKDYYNE